ncbi:hypothetical protein [Streptomyces sp. NPDC000983]|uniref:hypothetical protein n=1 Tax=Streptomyces sp. NPDC000983 TaxID=3154373 RepID=UPI0033339B9A
MRSSAAGARQLLIIAVGAALVTGSGATGPSGPSESSASVASAAPFDQRRVRADLEAAVAVAGLPEGETEVQRVVSPTQGATKAERERVALAARLSPCIVSWSMGPGDTSSREFEPGQLRRQLDVVLAHLVQRGWALGTDDEVPMEHGEAAFIATYKKQGWTLHARHYPFSSSGYATAMATQDGCFAGITDEEADLLDDH